MNAPKFTKGPWTYFVGNADGRGLIRIETAHDAKPEAGVHIASMPRGPQSELDAALIAAAPQLYAALERMLDKAYKQNWNDNYPEQVAQAKGALAKARGETP